MKLGNWLIIGTLALGFSSVALADEKKNHQIAENFCYAIQASSQCDELNMRLDTGGKVDALVGEQIHGNPGGKYSDSCSDGLLKAVEDKNLCEVAWEKFGCNGSVMPKLLQHNPFRNKNGVFCKF